MWRDTTDAVNDADADVVARGGGGGGIVGCELVLSFNAMSGGGRPRIDLFFSFSKTFSLPK